MIDTTKQWNELKKVIPETIDRYESDITNVINIIAFKGKSGGAALTEQSSWPLYYKLKKVELDKLVKIIQTQVNACQSRLFKTYTETYPRELSDRAKDKYIQSNDEYLSYYSLLIEIEELRDKFSAIADAFVSRGFALRDYTNLKVNSMQDDLI